MTAEALPGGGAGMTAGALPGGGAGMTAGALAEPQAVTPTAQPLWFLGTLVRLKLTGEQTGGRFALWEGVLPRGAAPPLHSHPQDETFYVVEGEVTVWLVERELAADRSWVETHARRRGAGTCTLAPRGMPHAFRVESDTARMLFLSAPAGIDEYVQALAEPARWPWLPPPPDGPRIPAERLAAVEREHGVVRYGPPPPAADRERNKSGLPAIAYGKLT